MKKVLSILLIALMLVGSSTTVLAAEDSLDIEKAAIQTLKNSQAVQNSKRQVTVVNKNYADITSKMNQSKAMLRYVNSYPLVEQIILLPLEFKDRLNQATNGQQVVTNAIRLSAYQNYITLVKAKSAQTIQQNLLNSLEADYQKAQLQQSLGEITPAQLRLSEITYIKAQSRYQSAQKSVDSASMTMNQAMGEDITKKYATVLDNNIVPADQIRPLNDYVNTALASRAEILNAQGTLATKKTQYDYGKAEVPTDFQFYIQKQEYIIASAQNDVDLAKINVQEDITNFYKSLELAMKNREAMKILDDQAVINEQMAEVQYENGQISLLVLDEAKVAQAQADVNYKNAQADAWLAQTTMDSACGIGYNPLSPQPVTVDFSLSPYPSENKSNTTAPNND
ncbi:TolC family protein [Desulfitobacterium sp.]|uniref:TolC family protein n=1 Tax=Desulfitobacterium sp. TaxID=49981 RepID=UPI002CBE2A8A|nr:TolC family protein [Desulfitobacterium sp.]HVJ49280.1 TolC family protein [Desulfitobacterium sp.]